MEDQDFTIKEVVVEIKDELKSFRAQYDSDQKKTDGEIAKRPTRAELYSTVGVLGMIVGVVVNFLSSGA